MLKCALILGAVFCVAHIVPSSLFNATIMGFVLCWLAVVTKTLWAPMLLHAMNNGFYLYLGTIEEGKYELMTIR